MELTDSNRSIVVMIDFQGKLMDLVHRPALVKAAAKRLLKLADLFEVPVVLTEQYPQGLGETHPEVLEVFDALETPKRRLSKISFGCCGDPSFEQTLRELRPDVAPEDLQLIVAGIEAHVCVMQTVLEALRADHQVQLCWEAVSGRGAEYREWALQRMQQAGASITNHESVAFEWARDKDHPRFKAMSRLIREGQLT